MVSAFFMSTHLTQHGDYLELIFNSVIPQIISASPIIVGISSF